ncbi:MAG: DUF6242 domain-containing protein [Bacteroidales bacterium]|nr:DUF6242 domain-containing protein [Bacteroidales bacterium]
MKNGFYILICSFIILNMTSCLGDSDEDEYIVSTDSQLTSFTVTTSSIPELTATIFTIDQVKSLVYNHDSLSYGMDLTDKKVKFYYSTGSGLRSSFQTEIDGDTIWVATEDSLEIAKLKQFDIYAPNGAKKTYTFSLNIHQVDPDSMQYALWVENELLFSSGNNKSIRWNQSYLTYTKENNQIVLYQSEDLKNWQTKPLTGLPGNVVLQNLQVTNSGIYICTEDGMLYQSHNAQDWNIRNTNGYFIHSVLGYFDSEKNKGLSLIADNDGIPVFALLAEQEGSQNIISLGGNVPENFPVSGFSVIYTSNRSTMSLVESPASVWATDNGINWIRFENPGYDYPAIKNGNAFIYNDKLYYIGGRLSDMSYNKNIYTSKDGGLVWETMASNTDAPDSFIFREQASVALDEQGVYFYILGGKNISVNPGGLTDIWKVGINSKIFEDTN